MPSDSFFHHIDPTEIPMTVESGVGELWPLNLARYYATFWFGKHDQEFIDEPTIDEIEETIRIAQGLLKNERSHFAGDVVHIHRPPYVDGADILDHLRYEYPIETSEFQWRLHTGRIIGEIDLLCAVALLQLERAADSMESENARSVAFFMSEAYNLVDRIKELGNARDEKMFSSISAQHLAGKRHEKTHKIRDKAIELYKSKEDWPSKRAAAKKIYPDVAEYARKIGKPLSPDRGPQTVYGYLLDYDKS